VDGNWTDAHFVKNLVDGGRTRFLHTFIRFQNKRIVLLNPWVIGGGSLDLGASLEKEIF